MAVSSVGINIQLCKESQGEEYGLLKGKGLERGCLTLEEHKLTLSCSVGVKEDQTNIKRSVGVRSARFELVQSRVKN